MKSKVKDWGKQIWVYSVEVNGWTDEWTNEQTDVGWTKGDARARVRDIGGKHL